MRRRRPIIGLVCSFAVAALVQSVGVPPAGARAAGAATTVSGTRWLTDVWCRSDGFCLAVGATTRGTGAVVVLRSSGAIGPVRPVPGSSTLAAIDCMPSGGCVAIGSAGLVPVVVPIAADGTPGVAQPVAGADDLWDVACPTANTCLATASVVEQVQSYPYYKTWSLFVLIENGRPATVQRFPLDYDHLVVGIDCPSSTTCVAVDGEVAVLSNSGGTWSASITWIPPSDLSGHATHNISCPTPGQCWATAAAFIPSGGGSLGVPGIAPVSANGIVGRVSVLIPQSGNAHGISCAAGTSTCTVVGALNVDDDRAFAVEASRGSPAAVMYWTNAQGFADVSCVTAASCGIVGGNGANGIFAWKGPIIS
jgi:hypothetical protein